MTPGAPTGAPTVTERSSVGPAHLTVPHGAALPDVVTIDGSEAGRALVALEQHLAAEVAGAFGAAERDACRDVVAAVVRGLPFGRGTHDPASPRAIAEQFVLDANGLERPVGQSLRHRVGRAGAVAFVTWLGLAESRERLRLLLGAPKAGPAPVTASSTTREDPPGGSVDGAAGSDDGAGHPWPIGSDGPDLAPPTLQELLAETLPEAARLRAALAALPAGSLAPKVRELVRLTSADTVDCRYCRNVRYRDTTGAALVNEELRATLAGGATGDALGGPDASAAVEIARAFLTGRSLDEDAVERASAGLRPEDQVDLLVTLQRFPAGSKAMVALGLVPERTPITLL